MRTTGRYEGVPWNLVGAGDRLRALARFRLKRAEARLACCMGLEPSCKAQSLCKTISKRYHRLAAGALLDSTSSLLKAQAFGAQAFYLAIQAYKSQGGLDARTAATLAWAYRELAALLEKEGLKADMHPPLNHMNHYGYFAGREGGSTHDYRQIDVLFMRLEQIHADRKRSDT
ncbi:hypothetical protein Lgee_1243 [Legionella geestiana]|uniref:Uncharacterized protein n=1 Tax=Legionella geestiana TaxID=45065 RepID=A0A0W0TUM5_9GAMM|nr:hypothetical protein [Legionella geestiana]KTC99305.1 hypothetical protein Lgee_1243 [Legionella geestiana]QBS11981.1 hypothetical protein E4T54_04035 [Legionella geestiana]STX53305.1 Uncharacterised protein [Legionella geestiana]